MQKAGLVSSVTGVSRIGFLRSQIEAIYSPVLASSRSLKVDTLNIEGVRVNIYRPEDQQTSLLPCIVYFHGGGWTFFSIDSYDTVTRRLSAHTGSVVVSVDYRLAPEYSYPLPFDDCVKVTRHMLHHGVSYQVDVNRIAVAGDSSGANLAAAVALRLSEEHRDHTPALKLQILIQPVLQLLTFNTPSYRENAFYSLVDRARMIEFWCNYIGLEPTPSLVESMARGRHISPGARRIFYSLYMSDAENIGKEKNDPKSRNPDMDEPGFDAEVSAAGVETLAQDRYLAPIMSDSVSLSPTALILVGDKDVVRDDGLVYARKLEEAGVNVTLKRFPGAGHSHIAPLLPDSFFWPSALTFSASGPAWNLVYQFIQDSL